MKNYIVVLEQSGEGCGYMIECGTKVIKLEAKNIEHAHERFALMVDPHFDEELEGLDWTKDYGGYCDENSLRSARIYEVGTTLEVDMDEIYDEIENKEILSKAKYKEAIERAQYEVLKRKFE